MTKCEAKQIALAIIATSDLWSIVYMQITGANPRLDGLTNAARKKIMVAVEEINQELCNQVSGDVVDFVVGS